MVNIPENPTFQDLVDAVEGGINNNSIKDAINGSDGQIITVDNPTSGQIVTGIDISKNNMKTIIGQALNLVIPSVVIPDNPSIDFSEYIVQLFNAMGLNGMDILYDSGNWVCPSGITSVLVILLGSGTTGKGAEYQTGDGQISERDGWGKGGNGGNGGIVAMLSNYSVIGGRSYPVVIGGIGTTDASNPSTFNGSQGSWLSGGSTGAGGAYNYSGYKSNTPPYGNDSYNGANAGDFQRQFQIGDYNFDAIISPGGKGGWSSAWSRSGSTNEESLKSIFYGGNAGRFSFPNIRNNPGQGGQGANVEFHVNDGNGSFGRGRYTTNGRTDGNAGAVIICYNKKIG